MTTFNNYYLSFLCNCTESTAKMTQKVIEARSIDALLLSDLSSDHCPTVDVQQWDKLTESVHHTTLSEDLSISPELNARAEI